MRDPNVLGVLGRGTLPSRSPGASGLRAGAKRALLSLALMGLASSPSSAQEDKAEVRFTRVYLFNGNVVEGQFVERTRSGVTLRIAGGDLTIPEIQVSRVEKVAYSERREVPKPQPRTEKPRPAPAPNPAAPAKDSPDTFERKVEEMLTDLRSVGLQQKSVVMRSLIDLGKAAAPYLTSRFEALDLETRMFVLEVLLEAKDPSTIPAIRKLTTSKLPTVRGHAAQLLAALGDASQAGALRALLADPDAKVRGSAVDALAALGDREAFDSITSLCKDPNAATRRKAIGASVQLSKKFELQHQWVHDLEVLIDQAQGELRADLVCALGQTGAREAPRELSRYLRDDAPEVRASAVGALADLGAKDEGDALVRQMDVEKDKWVRLRMITAVQRLRLEPAVPNLIDWLEDPDREIKTAARASLVDITSQNYGEDKSKWAAWWARSHPK